MIVGLDLCVGQDLDVTLVSGINLDASLAAGPGLGVGLDAGLGFALFSGLGLDADLGAALASGLNPGLHLLPGLCRRDRERR